MGPHHTLGSVADRLRDGASATTPEIAARLNAAFGAHVDWLQVRAKFELRRFAPQEIEECVQETLLIAWSRLPSYHPVAPFRSWLAAILFNVCRNARARRRDALTDDGELDAEDRTVDPTIHTLVRDERDRLVREAAAATLDPADQDIVEWRYVYEYSYDQIAELVGVAGTEPVRVSLQRSRRRLMPELRRRLAAAGHTPP